MTEPAQPLKVSKRMRAPGIDGTRQRVLIVSHAFTPEGPRRQIDALSEYVDARLVAPRVSSRDAPWPSVTRVDGTGGCSTFRRLRLFGHQYFLATVSMGVASFRPHVVHIDHDPWSAIFWQTILISRLFARRASIVAGAKKNTYRDYPGFVGRAKRFLAHAGMRFVDRIEAASEMSSRMYQREFGVEPERISVITHMGVDTELFRPRLEPPTGTASLIRVGYCGQYSAHKGIGTLIQACGILNSQGVPIELSTIGEGPMRAEMSELAKSRPWLKVGEPTLHDEVAGFMSTLDIYVLAAEVLKDHEEHDAHALLQAMACGVPVIGTRSGIIPEILAGGYGVLVRPADPNDLAEAIATLANEPGERARLARDGREKIVERHSLDVVASMRAAHYGATGSAHAAIARDLEPSEEFTNG